jgi:proline iminopeptidase
MADELIFGLAQRHYADIAAVFSRYPIEKVLLFGSRAKGTASAISDFDLAVIAPQLSDEQFSALWAELHELPLIFKLDVVHWDKVTSLKLKQRIVQDGVQFWPKICH